MNTPGNIIKILLVVIGIAAIVFLPAIGQYLSGTEEGEGLSYGGVDASFIWIMFPSWVYLGGALGMIMLALKFMSGGTLARPLLIMGLGVLIDALAQIFSSLVFIGLVPASSFSEQLILIGGLAFRFSVVLGVAWMAQVFGVLQSR